MPVGQRRGSVVAGQVTSRHLGRRGQAERTRVELTGCLPPGAVGENPCPALPLGWWNLATRTSRTGSQDRTGHVAVTVCAQNDLTGHSRLRHVASARGSRPVAHAVRRVTSEASGTGGIAGRRLVPWFRGECCIPVRQSVHSLSARSPPTDRGRRTLRIRENACSISHLRGGSRWNILRQTTEGTLRFS
jgi:hypothetical protein